MPELTGEQSQRHSTNRVRVQESSDPLDGDNDIPLDYGSISDEEEEMRETASNGTLSPILSFIERTQSHQQETIPEEWEDFDPFLPGDQMSDSGEGDFSNIPEEELAAEFSDEEGELDLNDTSLAQSDVREGSLPDQYLKENLVNNCQICRAIAPWTNLLYPQGVRREDRDTITPLYIGNRYYVWSHQRFERTLA
jgi:hypothetical protein